MKSIGLHIRITTTIVDAVRYAIDMQLGTFQCFLLHQTTGTYLNLKQAEIKEFLALRNDYFTTTFVHGSYWINLGNKEVEGNQYLLKRELSLARQLGFTHMVLHAGSATGWQTNQEGIDCVARVLNGILKQEKDIKIVLENTAHGGKAIGSNVYDLRMIQEKLQHPEKVLFCIDTAHAYAFGYNITDDVGRAEFIMLLNDTIGLSNIALIHLNDTKEDYGLKRDKHDILGHGNIGIEALRKFVLDDRLRHIPLIMELPIIPGQEQASLITTVRQWHTT